MAPLIQTPYGSRVVPDAPRGVVSPHSGYDAGTEAKRQADAAESAAAEIMEAYRAHFTARQAAQVAEAEKVAATFAELRRPGVKEAKAGVAVALERKGSATRGVVVGYGSVFGEKDHAGDATVRGAFAESLAEHDAKGRLVPMLWHHDTTMPIGVWTVAREDSKGLYLEGQITPGTVVGREALALLESGALSGLSIGFSTLEDEYDRQRNVRLIRKVKLYEVSLVTFPSNDSARVQAVKEMR